MKVYVVTNIRCYMEKPCEFNIEIFANKNEAEDYYYKQINKFYESSDKLYSYDNIDNDNYKIKHIINEDNNDEYICEFKENTL